MGKKVCLISPENGKNTAFKQKPNYYLRVLIISLVITKNGDKNVSDTDIVYKIRFHARGGQEGVTAAQLCVYAFDGPGVCQPKFGAERMGAPTESYVAMSKNPNLVRSNEQVYSPHYVGILDDSLLIDSSIDVAEGLAPGGTLIVNTTMSFDDIRKYAGRDDINLARVDATCLALDYLGRNITNTIILGSLVKASDIFTLDQLADAISTTFKAKIAQKNVEVIRVAAEQTEIEKCGIELDYHADYKEKWSHIGLGKLGARDLDLAGVWYTPGGSSEIKTSSWAVNTADFDKEKCINCYKCVFICPDVSILREQNEEGEWVVSGLDKFHCKGCMLCVSVCPTQAVFNPADACEIPLDAPKEEAKGGAK